MTLTTDNIALLLNQFQDSENLKTLLEQYLARCEDSNTILTDMLADLNVNDAVGVWLDIIGAIVGIERPGEVQDPDATFTFADGLVFRDGDMEESGVTNWTATGGSIVTKNTTASRVYKGTRSLEVDSTGFGLGALQTLTAPFGATTFNIKGWAYELTAGDSPGVSQDGVTRWTHTAGAGTWEQFDLTLNVADGVDITLGQVSGTLTSSVFFDEVGIEYDTAEGFGVDNGILDGDAEKAGTADWLPVNSAIIGKWGSYVHSGTQSLFVAKGGSTLPSAAQRVTFYIIDGLDFNVTGYCKHVNVADASAVPVIRQSTAASTAGSTIVWTGATGTAEQSFDVDLNTDDGTYLLFGYTSPATGDTYGFDDMVVSADIGGLFNALSGLTTGALMGDDEYREFILGKAASYIARGTVQDIWNFFGYAFGMDVIIDNTTPGQVAVVTPRSFVGEERALVEELAPVVAGVRLELEL